MKTTKIMLTGFAIFAAMLMLMTTTMAGPVTESTNMDAIEQAQQELIDSMEAMFEKIERDQELSKLMEQITNDQTTDRNSRSTRFENTDSINKEALKALNDYFESTYSSDMERIESQFNNLIDESQVDQDTDLLTMSPEILGFLPIDGAMYQVGSDGMQGVTGYSTSAGSPDFMMSSSGTITLLNEIYAYDSNNGDGGANNLDSGEAEYAGFLFNQDGGMLVPGYGWVYPDDPLWDDFFAMHNGLQGMPMSQATVVLDIFAAMLNSGEWFPGYLLYLLLQIIADIIILIFLNIAGAILDALENLGALIGDVIYSIVDFFLYIYMIIETILLVILEFLGDPQG